jgi:hypothetical protein
MKITRKRIAMAVLVVAVGALIAERTLTDTPALGPEQASAAEAPRQFTMPDLSKLPLVPPTDGPIAERSTLADRLQVCAESHGLAGQPVGDAFRPKEVWGPRLSPDSGTSGSRPGAAAGAHRLTATFVSGSGGMAIVNGQCIHVGQSLGGMKLTSVSRDSATLSDDDGDVITLRLANGAGGEE